MTAEVSSCICRSSSVIVRLEITDENDERPTFAYGVYTFGTYENQPSGTEVGTVAAVDRDLPPFNEVEYHLRDDGSDDGVFEIGRHTGRITATRPLDRENESEYHLTVVASPRGSAQVCFEYLYLPESDSNKVTNLTK